MGVELIWHMPVQTMLELFLSSTSRRFYFTEIHDITGLSRPTIGKTLRVLMKAGCLQKHADTRSLDSVKGARRVYYSLTTSGINRVRL